MNSDNPSFNITLVFPDLLRRYFLHIIIFLSALFFILTISNPAVFFNDEWITLNQLRQMDNGQQVIVNEGTYGVFKNGTSTPYFDAKERYLGYTLMLPVLSWPMLKLFSLFGDNFRLPVLFIWALLPILAMVLIAYYCPKYSRLGGIPWLWIIFTIMIGLLLFNLVCYYPFPFFGDTVPREIAAIVFTQHILFALLAVVIFSIISLYTKDTWYSLFGLIICLGCSSYIFWATNGKDHLLTVTILAISLFFLIRYLQNGNYLDGLSGFIAIGLLAWARPEFAFVMFFLSSGFIILLNVYLLRKKKTSPFPFHIRNIFLPLATIFGALPFFLNNFYVNNNPLIPTFLVYLSKNDANLRFQNVSVSYAGSGTNHQVIHSGMISPLLNKVMYHFSIQSADFLNDFVSVLFNPKSGAISIFAVAPIGILILIIIGFLLYSHRKQFFTQIPWMSLFLLLLFIGLPITYAGGIQGLNNSPGITPDIRYLSPIYLVISLLGIFLVYHLYSKIDWKKIVLMTLCVIGLAVPVNLYMLLMIFTAGGSAIEYIKFYKVFSILIVCISAIFLILSMKNERFKDYFALFLGALVISPLSWQILMTYFFASAKFNGYPFWIPMMELFYNRIIFVY